MTDWRNSVLAFSALPEVGPLLMAATPAWIWSRDGRLLWANPAGGARLRAKSFAELISREQAFGRSLGREVESLMRSTPDTGTLARLRLLDDLLALPVACRCRRIRAGEERGLLAVEIEAAAGPDLAQLAAFFAGGGVAAAILDGAGEIVARAGLAKGQALDDTGAAEFAARGEVRRLCLVPLAAAGPGTERAPPPEEAAVDLPPATAAEAEEASPVEPAHLSDEPALPAGTEAAEQEPSKRDDRKEVSEPAREPRAEPPRTTRRLVIAPKGPASAPVRPVAATALGGGKGAQQAAAAPKAAPEPAEPLEQPPSRSISAGRVARELSRKPVRFLWQTDSADRFLFVSPGLSQVVGRNAEIVGERWQDAAARLRLDPTSRIARAVAQRDTWSGQTAWWPIEGSNVRVPAELTALPIFGPDHSFQGYRGFGVLRPAESLMPAAFEARFGTGADGAPMAEQLPPYEEATATAPANVVPIRADLERAADQARLTAQERSAFEEIAAALRERVVQAPVNDAPGEAESRPAAPPEPPPATPANGAPPAAPLTAHVEPPGVNDPAPVRSAGEEGANSAAGSAGPPAPDQHKAAAPPPAEEPAAEASAPEAPPQAVPHSRPENEPAKRPPRAPSRPSAERLDRALGEPASEGQAHRRARELAAILDTATDGVVVMNAEGTIESVNAGAEALFGLEAHELHGTDFAELLTPESRQSALDYLSGLTGNGVASVLEEGREVEAQAGPGSIPLFMTMGRISGENGGRYCAVLRDITQWKRTERELVAAKQAAEAASAQKSEFIARVSHEIRTPLNAIIGFAEVMIEERFGTIENERYREYLRDIRSSGEHVVSLINDLLDISKIEAGKLDLEFTAVPLNELVRECIGLMQPQANRAHVVLRSSLSRDVPAIVADQRTMRQIIFNLLSNSVKFTGPGGQVIASTSLLESGEALLRIRDTGAGMSEEELARALEPFRQIATSALADRTGTGLGLPLTNALVEANRASLSIRSARGEGTVVTVTFPPTRVLSE